MSAFCCFSKQHSRSGSGSRSSLNNQQIPIVARSAASSTKLGHSCPTSSHDNDNDNDDPYTMAMTMARSTSGNNNSSKNQNKRLISFITDVEGDANYFDRFVQNSKILDFESIQDSGLYQKYNYTFLEQQQHHNNNNDNDNTSTSTNSNNDQEQKKDSQQKDQFYFPYEKHVVFKSQNQLQQPQQEKERACDSSRNHSNNEDDVDDDGDGEERNNHDNNNNNNHNNNQEQQKQRHPILVVGGDMWDKGGADLYVTRQLISLQRRYGQDQVHFILGNRDLNKMRILQELGVDDIGNNNNNNNENDDDQNGDNDCDKKKNENDKYCQTFSSSTLPFHHGAYWLSGTGNPGDAALIAKGQEYLKKHSNSNSNSNNHDHNHDHNDLQHHQPQQLPLQKQPPQKQEVLPEEYAQGMVPSNTPAERLQWMLQKSMGSPDAFELRRSELQREQEIHFRRQQQQQHHQQHYHPIDNSIRITDEQVVKSYKSSTHPYGVMGEYISNGKLASYLGGGAMFIHGALPFTTDIITIYKEYEKRNDVDGFWKEFYTKDALPFLLKDGNDDAVDDNNSTIIDTTMGWVSALNAFVKQQVEHWKRNISSAEKKNNDKNFGSSRKTVSKSYNTSSSDTGSSSNDISNRCNCGSSSNSTESANDNKMWASTGGYQHNSMDNDDCGDNINKDLFGSLMQYGMGWIPPPILQNPKPGVAVKNPTVVYDSWLEDGMPRRFYKNNDVDEKEAEENNSIYRKMVNDFFTRSHLDVIVTGHQPGTFSFLIIALHSFLIVSCSNTSACIRMFSWRYTRCDTSSTVIIDDAE